MSASLDNGPSSTSNEPVITPQLPPHYALGLRHVGITAFWVVVFLFFSYLPLRSTDLWGHTLWGHWILQNSRLPVEDPFFPLAQGMAVVDSAWLSQVTFAAIDQQFGPQGLSALFALLVTATLLLFARTFYLISRRMGPTMVGVLLVLMIGWSRATTLRPETFGVLLLAAIVLLVTRDLYAATEGERASKRWLTWLGIPLLMMVWANFHGSYLIGMIFLGCVALGHAIDVAWAQRSLRAAFADATVQRFALVTELSLLATLINPYGVHLLIYNLTFAGNPNLLEILEWQPLVILGVGGREFAVSIVLLLVLFRISRARVTATQVLLLAVFGYAAIKGIRMLGWYAPMFAWVMLPHLSEVWSRWRPLAAAPEPVSVNGTDYKLPPGRSFHYTLICGLLVWLGISFAPWSSAVLGGKSRTEAQLYDKNSSPLALVGYLQKNPPQGQTFHPQHWGDWLLRNVPTLQPFVTSNIHLAPQQVWADHQRISAAQPGWQRVLDRYNVRTLIVDREVNAHLFQAMKQNTDWQIIYQDDQASVYRRISPTPGVKSAASLEPTPGGEKLEATPEPRSE